MKCFKIILKGILILFFTLIVLPVIVFCCTQIIPNNINAKRLIKKLEMVDAPEGSTKINDFYYVGWVSGSGAGCDVVSGILYKTDATAFEITSHYRGKEIEGSESWYSVPVELKIPIIEKTKATTHFYLGFENEEIEKKFNLGKYCGKRNYCFFVFVQDTTDETMDIRCY